MNEILDYVNDEIASIDKLLEQYHNDFQQIDSTINLLKSLQSINNKDIFDNNTIVFNIENIDDNNIVSSYNHIKSVWCSIKALGLDTIALEEIPAYHQFKNDLFICLQTNVSNKKVLDIKIKTLKQRKRDCENLIQKLNNRQLLDYKDIELIVSLIEKKCDVKKQKNFLISINDYNDLVMNNSKQNESDEIYNQSIHQIFDNDNNSIDYFNELLEYISISNSSISPIAFEMELEKLYDQYSNNYELGYSDIDIHFTTEFFFKCLDGLILTIKKIISREKIELQDFKLTATEDEYDNEIIETFKQEIQNYQEKLEICQKFKNRYLGVDDITNNDLLTEKDFKDILEKIKNNEHNIVLFGYLFEGKLKGNCIKMLDKNRNDVQSDLKDIKKLLKYLIT